MAAAVFDPWLPQGALAAAAERLPVRAAVADWAAKWFAHGGVSLTGMGSAAGDMAIGGAAMELDDGLIAAIDDDAVAVAGTLMFGDPDGVSTAADTMAIAAAADQALADWRRRMAQLLGLPRDAVWRPRAAGTWAAGYRFRIKLGSANLALGVSNALLVATVKARLRPDPARASLGTIAAGLGPQPVALSALLGECRLSMRDLAALGEGDVVVLDRGLTDPATLVVDRTPQRAACRIAATATHLDLTLA